MTALFKLSSEFAPAGDQPRAIERLTELTGEGHPHIVLLGITGGYFVPRQERLAALAEGGAGPEYAALATQVARVAFLAAALVVVAIFLMVVKP